METLKRIIEEHPFFKNLDEEYIDVIVGCASNVRFTQDEIIMREGSPADKCCLVREGIVAVDILGGPDDAITLQTIGTGGIVGWSWLMPPHRHRFNCRAAEDTRAIVFDGGCLRDKCNEDHDLGYELLKRLASVFVERLEATRMQLLELRGYSR